MAIVEVQSGLINRTTACYGKLLNKVTELTASRRNVAQHSSSSRSLKGALNFW